MCVLTGGPLEAPSGAGVDFVLRPVDDICSFRVSLEALHDLIGEIPVPPPLPVSIFRDHEQRVVERACELFVPGDHILIRSADL